MSYVRHILQPDEKLIIEARPHWIAYWRAAAALIVALALLLVPAPDVGLANMLHLASAFMFVVAVVMALIAAFHRWGTEIAVTDRRVIYKRGIISRETAEMNMDKVETVLVDQTLSGRLLNYGTISIRGTGASIESLPMISHPIALRSAITAR